MAHSRRSIAEQVLNNIRQEVPDSDLSIQMVGRAVDNIRDRKIFEVWTRSYQFGDYGVSDGFLTNSSVTLTWDATNRNHQGIIPAIPVDLPNMNGIRQVKDSRNTFSYLNQANTAGLPDFLRRSFRNSFYWEGDNLFVSGGIPNQDLTINIIMSAVSHTLGWDETYPCPGHIVQDIIDETTKNYLQTRVQIPKDVATDDI